MEGGGSDPRLGRGRVSGPGDTSQRWTDLAGRWNREGGIAS